MEWLRLTLAVIVIVAAWGLWQIIETAFVARKG